MSSDEEYNPLKPAIQRNFDSDSDTGHESGDSTGRYDPENPPQRSDDEDDPESDSDRAFIDEDAPDSDNPSWYRSVNARLPPHTGSPIAINGRAAWRSHAARRAAERPPVPPRVHAAGPTRPAPLAAPSPRGGEAPRAPPAVPTAALLTNGDYTAPGWTHAAIAAASLFKEDFFAAGQTIKKTSSISMTEFDPQFGVSYNYYAGMFYLRSGVFTRTFVYV